MLTFRSFVIVLFDWFWCNKKIVDFVCQLIREIRCTINADKGIGTFSECFIAWLDLKYLTVWFWIRWTKCRYHNSKHKKPTKSLFGKLIGKANRDTWMRGELFCRDLQRISTNSKICFTINQLYYQLLQFWILIISSRRWNERAAGMPIFPFELMTQKHIYMGVGTSTRPSKNCKWSILLYF